MLFDPSILIREPGKVVAVVAIIMVGKTVAAIGLVLAFRYPLNTALTVGASLAQIGEFSFILAGLGMSLGLLSAEGQSLILAGAMVSIALNAVVFAAIEPLQAWVRSKSSLAQRLERTDDPLAILPDSTDEKHLTGQVVIVGYGRVGRHIAADLRARGVRYVVAEQNREIVESLRREGTPAVSGDAAEPAVLIQAHVARAAMLVIATADPVDAPPHGGDGTPAQPGDRGRGPHAQRRRSGTATEGKRRSGCSSGRRNWRTGWRRTWGARMGV